MRCSAVARYLGCYFLRTLFLRALFCVTRPVARPDKVSILGDLFDRTVRDNAPRFSINDGRFCLRPRVFVALLDQEPILATFCRATRHPDERPTAVQLVAVEMKGQLAC